MKLLNPTTRFGDLDPSFEPSGTAGCAELAPRSVAFDLGEGLVVPVAALEDITRSNTLRLLPARTRQDPT